MKSLSALAAILVLASAAAAQLPAGNYTIDPSLPAGGTNFQTWAAASAALAPGVVGPGAVTFTVASTTFVGALSFATISGTSAATPVTFVAIGAPAIIDAGGAQDALSLNNAQSYLTFENFEIRNFTRYGLNINATSTLRCTFSNFRKIVTDGPASSSGTIFSARIYYADDCVFEDCKFKGGGYTMRSESINRNRFSRCEFDGKAVAARLLAPYNSNDANNFWENCFFHDTGPSGVAIYSDLSSYGNMYWHNTVVVTTSVEAVRMGSCCAWTRANSFRNNIVVNLGTGRGIMYGAAAPAAGAVVPGLLEFNDIDFNCYYVPNGTAVEFQANAAYFPAGSLASWQAFLAANPGIIPAGGGTAWDQNSIQTNPMLVSMTTPYDIHLASGSPCIDTATSTYVPGVWVTNPSNFATTTDFEGDVRPATLRDIGADELACLVPQFETNSAASSLDIDGLQGSACIPAVTLKNQNAPAILAFGSTNVGLGWEAVLATANLVPASFGGIITANGQILNINFGAPSVIFLNGGSFPSFASPFPGNFLLGFNAPPFPFVASIQMANIDPSHPDGFALSQGCELNVP